MIIHFIGAEQYLLENIDLYRKIVDEIHKSGHMLARNWIEPTYYGLNSGQNYENVKQQSQDTMYALEQSNLVVVDTEGLSIFSLGYQVATALGQKKPVLLLRRNGNSGGLIIDDLNDPLLTRKKVNEKNIQTVVRDFIKHNATTNKDMRVNFAIDRKIHNHLRWEAFKSNKTKAEIVRDLVLEDMKGGE